MATPRKHYFRMADSILRELPTPELRGILAGLLAFLNQRWARDGLTPAQSCEVVLSAADLHLITGRYRIGYAEPALRRCLAGTSAAVRRLGATVSLTWPKYAEFQDLKSEVRAILAPSASASAPARGADASKSESLRAPGPAAAPAPPAAAQAPPSDVPDPARFTAPGRTTIIPRPTTGPPTDPRRGTITGGTYRTPAELGLQRLNGREPVDSAGMKRHLADVRRRKDAEALERLRSRGRGTAP